MDILETLKTLWTDSGFQSFFVDGGWKNLVMIIPTANYSEEEIVYAIKTNKNILFHILQYYLHDHNLGKIAFRLLHQTTYCLHSLDIYNG